MEQSFDNLTTTYYWTKFLFPLFYKLPSKVYCAYIEHLSGYWNEHSTTNLICLSTSASSLVQPWVQPEKANMSISYLRCRATKGPFSRSMRTNLYPKVSIWGVNFSAWKLTRHLSFWRSNGIPLFAKRASVLLKCNTLCLPKSGRICRMGLKA